MAEMYTQHWKDYYAILKVPRGCDDEEQIRYNYKRLMQVVHPDINPELGDREAMDLNEAFECLRDVGRREAYWRYYKLRPAQSEASTGGTADSEALRREWEAVRRAREEAEAKQHAYEEAEAWRQEEERQREAEEAYREEKQQEAEAAFKAKDAAQVKQAKKILLMVGVFLTALVVWVVARDQLLPGSHYRKGETLFAAGAYSEARREFEQAGSYKDAKSRAEKADEARKTEELAQRAAKYADMLKEYGFKVQENCIEFGGRLWRVLDLQDSRALLISKEPVESAKFDAQYNGVGMPGWDRSSVRKYLNETFYNEFSEEDRERITLSSIPYFSALDGGLTALNESLDYIFLLSAREAEQTYFAGKSDRACGSDWWLLSPGQRGTIQYVDKNGNIQSTGVGSVLGLRPVMYITYK